MDKVDKVGFIGLGIMGSRMARNLLAAGRELVVCDIDAKAVAAIKQKGAKVAASPREVAEQVDVLLLSLPDSPQIFEVTNGADGIAEGAHKGLVVIDHSTVAPMTPQRLSEELEPLGVSWLDAPVSGGPAGAEAATLTIMVGGDEKVLERCRPILETVGGNVQYMGASGMGATTKIVNQLALGIEMMAMFEAFTLGVTAGIDARRLWEVLRTSSSSCWTMENHVPLLLLGNRYEEVPAAWFALKLMHKDMRIAVSTASSLKVPLAAGSLTEQMFAIAEGQGWGEQDHWAPIKLYANSVGIKKW
jgi:2-hydroxymethylglutarate dehydrogenase